MAKQEPAVIEATGTEILMLIEGPRFPAMPVFDEHLDSYLAKVTGFRCDSRVQFDASKLLASEGVKLKGQVIEAFRPRKQAFDAAKQPTLDAERELLARIEVAVKSVDAVAVAWLTEQKRIADIEAERKRQEEIARREEARQVEIKRLEEEREKERLRLEAEREQERLRLEAQKANDANLAEEWGEEATGTDTPIDLPPIVEPPPVIIPEVIAPRPVKADLGFSYRKGAKTKQTLKFKLIDPEAINEKYKSADPMKIKARIANYTNLIKEPTEEQIAKLAEEIGKGVELFWE